MTWGYEDYHLTIDLLKRGAKLEVIEDILVCDAGIVEKVIYGHMVNKKVLSVINW